MEKKKGLLSGLFGGKKADGGCCNMEIVEEKKTSGSCCNMEIVEEPTCGCETPKAPQSDSGCSCDTAKGGKASSCCDGK